MTWQECVLVPMIVNFTIPTVKCTPVNKIPYCDYKQVDTKVKRNKLTCEVSVINDNDYFLTVVKPHRLMDNPGMVGII